MRHCVALMGLLAAALCGAQAQGEEREGAARDAWIEGTVEAIYALNRHLSAFAITTDVNGGVVHLTGNVANDIDRDLAGELAKNIEGVVEVDNDLVVTPDVRRVLEDVPPQDVDRSFGTWIDDATTTASVKTRLLGNTNTKGLQIDVDTRGAQVTLTGEVATVEEKTLAEDIALNTDDVRAVHNQLILRTAL